MDSKKIVRSTAKAAAAAIGFAAASYVTYAGVSWIRYGKPAHTSVKNRDALLDMFMPAYEVADRHKIDVAAPPEIALAAAAEMNLEDCGVIRGIFKGRQMILGGKSDETILPRGLLEQVRALGWGLLAELPGREIVIGAVTKPWEPNPVFRSLPPDEFAAFAEAGYVKIVWTLRADPAEDGTSVFRTETRAVATDPEARKKFRRYWAFLSPGIIAIRKMMLPAVQKEAENRWMEIAA